MHQLYLPEPTTNTLTNVNHRKEGRGEDEDVNALDLAFELEFQQDHFDQLFAEPAAIQAALFHDGEVIENKLKPLAFDDAKVDNQRLTVSGVGHSDMVFVPATVTLKHAKPRTGPVMVVKFSVAVYPTVGQIGPLCDMVGEYVKITLQDAQVDGAEEESEDASEAETEAAESPNLSVV